MFRPPSASSPFDHPRADVVLRSSDNMDFRVFKLFLSLASPFFEALFNLPQPSDENTGNIVEMIDGLPVVPVLEDSGTLDILLRFCYPRTLTPIPPLDHFKNAFNVLEAAKKYSLDEVEKAICEALFNPKILEVDSLRCFAVARRARLRDQTIMAAKYSLREPLIPEWFEEIELVTAADLLALLTYHQKCGSALQQLHVSFSWIEQHYQNQNAVLWILGKATGRGCNCPRAKVAKLFDNQPTLWWEEFMDATFQALKDKPCAHTIHEMIEKTIQEIRRRSCQSCSSNIASVMCEFADLFAKKVEELVSEVELPLRY
ncbi:hypothetical protein V8B97DRAFT_260338 [Scleroderma yunnanense]